MILDTSALVAIFFRDAEQARFSQLIADAASCHISVATFVELSMVVQKHFAIEAIPKVDMFFQRAGISIEPVSVDQALIARQALLEYGRGRHPAALNYGDCFAYALAKDRDMALLFKGNHFSQTDIRSATFQSNAQTP